MDDVLADAPPSAAADAAERHDGAEPPDEPPRLTRSDRRWILGSAALQVAVFAPVVFTALFRPTLHPTLWLWHAQRIRETFRTPTEPIQPQFGWAAISRAVDGIIPAGDVRVSALITGIAAVALTGGVLFFVLRIRDDGTPLLARPAALAGALLIAWLESPAVIQGMEKIASPDTSFVPLYYGFVPTTVAVTGLNIILVWMTARLIDGTLARRAHRWLPVLAVVTAAIKPTLVFPLAIAAVAVAWAHQRRLRAEGTADGGPLAPVLKLVLLPAIAISFAQHLIITYFVLDRLQGGVVIAPFEELRALGGFGWQFWLVLLLPLGLLVLVRAPLFEDRAVTLAFLSAALGIGAAIMFARSGRTPDIGAVGGDVLQLASGGITTAVVFGLRRACVLWQDGRLRRSIAAVLVILLLPYAAAGLRLWVCDTGLARCYAPEIAPQWPQKPIEEE
ncbi:hypothetical protein ACE2AJ_08010 [Aquihabitans daechungensis]|uniref:hypothetical protein n=1 Tax=Aquihabitans daechungensis TaxID=1052257 RepID=UPI003BA1BFA1